MAISSKLSFTDQVAAFSAAAAYGITQRVINTWNPYLVRTPRVLGTGAGGRAGNPAGTSRDAMGRLRAQAASRHLGRHSPRSSARAFRGTQDRAHGRHLSALGATRRAHSGSADGDIASFPAAPDRWLVMRMSPATDGQQQRVVKGWVLRSGDRIRCPSIWTALATERLRRMPSRIPHGAGDRAMLPGRPMTTMWKPARL